MRSVLLAALLASSSWGSVILGSSAQPQVPLARLPVSAEDDSITDDDVRFDGQEPSCEWAGLIVWVTLILVHR